MEQQSINQRLNLIVDHFEKGKKAAFARKAGISPQGAQEILAGRKGDPSFKVLVKILEAYPQVNADWLVLGRGTLDVTINKSTSTLKNLASISSSEIEKAVQQIRITQLEQNRASALLYKEPTESVEIQSNYFVIYGKLHLIRSEIRNAILNNRPAVEIEALKEQEVIIQAEVIINEVQYKKHTLKNELTVKEAQSAVYYTDGEPDMSKPFGGLLHYRLNISIELAALLINSNRISAVEIGGKGYCITEQAVRAFLEEA